MDRPRDNTAHTWLEPNSALKPALVSSLLAWLAFPPVGWGFVAWLAPIGWLSLVARQELPGRRPYRAIWFAGFIFWLLTVHWIRLPHPANYAALTVLAAFLGCYLSLFVALARVGVHRLQWPLWLVAPVVWTGIDWLRNHVMTGFGFGSLAHTQSHFLEVIQIADIVGEYGVTFLIVLVASCFTCALARQSTAASRSRVVHILYQLMPAAFLFGAVLSYGILCFQGKYTAYNRAEHTQRVALIQGNTLADWKGDASKQQSIMEEYMNLSLEAVARSREQDGRTIDLIVWPETTFRQTLATVEPGYQVPEDLVHKSYLTAAQLDLAEFVRQTGSAILTGIDHVHILPDSQGQPDYKTFNSSVLMDNQQQIVGTYDKMHRVPFGEYTPLAEWFPVLYQLTPLTGGVGPGAEPSLLQLGELRIAPNICYETCVPHLIRRHVNREDRIIPDVLVNLTNDSWYWGSSELDMHLACGVFRAVENQLPLVIAANGGLSAHVGPSGTVHQVTERQKTATLLADLRKPDRSGLTLYAKWGDWFAGLCVVCCVVLAVIGWRRPTIASPASRRDSAA